MKTLSTCFISITLMALFSCNGSSDQKVEETKKTTAQPSTNAITTSSDTAKKTTITLGPEGASVQTKSGTTVKASKQAVSVGTKHVKVSIIPGKN